MAIVPEGDDAWDLYLINQNEHSIRNILVVTEAKSEFKQSSKLRYFLESLTPISFIKFETIFGEVAQLENSVSVTYYVGLDIFEKEFVFSIPNLTQEKELPIIGKVGFLLD